MEDQGTKDGAVTGSKADQKKDSTEGPLSETEVCSDFGFIEPALKCNIGGVALTIWCRSRSAPPAKSKRLSGPAKDSE